MNQYPVFIINGLLDSGKSSFIIDTIKNDGFSAEGNTLLFVFEEGEVEYDPKELAKYNVHLAVFHDPSEFTADVVYELTESFHPGRILIEANSMWNFDEVKFPQNLKLAKTISFIDFTTFPVYFNNMRQKFVDNLKFSDMIIINRCDDINELGKYQTSLKLINNQAQWITTDSNGDYQEAFEEPLPYDIDADIIKVENDDFARWYIDTFDHKERYDGKKIEFNGQVFISKKLPKGSFFIGRYAMTCCANDVQLYAHLCNNMMGKKVKNKMWFKIVANIKYEMSKEYEEEELILEPISLDPIAPLENPILNLI